MRVRFHGAAGEVTGSMHEIEAAGRRVLLDCGLIQGSRASEARNAAPFPFDPAQVDAVVLSHAHIDHIGRIPLLVKRGFRGPIFAHPATLDLMPIMLMDSASLAASDAERANRRQRAGEPEVLPLFDREDVLEAMRQVRALDYERRQSILPGIDVALRDAGHILGSSIVELWADARKLVFSGDLGLRGTPILCDPTPISEADLVLMESTYGDRNHRERLDTVGELGEVFERAWNNGGNVLIPAFAVGRTQELLYWFALHWDDWQLSRWQIFLDSPMAAKVVAVYDRHHELFDAQARAVGRGRPHPFRLPNLHTTESNAESIAINRIEGGAIVIAGSGMANGGRILHHLKQNLGRDNAHVVFEGYQAEGTLGRRLVDGAKWVRIHGRD
jgi:metallo-beta-lactamase family protein